MTASKKITVSMKFERETKGAIRYHKEEDDEGLYSIGTQYIRKHAIKRAFGDSIPKAIKITIEVE